MKKSVVVGIAGVAIAAGAYTYYQNPDIINQITSDTASQTQTVAQVEETNQRIQNTPREKMIIECTNETEFINSFKAMKDKMPEQDQARLNEAFNKIIQRELQNKPDIEDHLCREFQGWSEAKFLDEAAK